MARIRSIKPEFWVSEQVAECSTNARLTFVGLWNFCDDNGVHPAKPKTLKAELFPMDDCSSADVAAWMEELIRTGLVGVFEVEGQSFWYVTGWAKHQKIDRPSTKYPAPPALNGAPCDAQSSTSDRRSMNDEASSSSPSLLAEDSANARRAPPPGVDRSGEEGSGVEGDSPKARTRPSTRKPKTTLPPDFTVSDRVRSWATSKGYDRLDEHMEHFVGKARAKDYRYVDWDEAFMGAVRDDWANLRSAGVGSQRRQRSVLHADDNLDIYAGAR